MQCAFCSPSDTKEIASSYGRLPSKYDFVNPITNFDLDAVDIDAQMLNISRRNVRMLLVKQTWFLDRRMQGPRNADVKGLGAISHFNVTWLRTGAIVIIQHGMVARRNCSIDAPE